MLKQGQAISPGMPLCNILNLNDLKIIGAVTEAYAAKVKKGDEVQIYFPDLDKEITTRVSYVSKSCLLYTSAAADERSSVDLGGRRIIKKNYNDGIDVSAIHTTERRAQVSYWYVSYQHYDRWKNKLYKRSKNKG